MKKYNKIIIMIAAILMMLSVFSVSAFALTEQEVQEAIAKYGVEKVNGNIVVWFLCAVAFLKVSQKIDSFMMGLGINVGQTGGSMLSEAAIAIRGLSAAKQFIGGFGGGKGTGGDGQGSGSSSGSGGFAKGGLVGMVGRGFTNSGIKKATGKSGGSIGGKVYTSSVNKGGSFANNVIGRVATGKISSIGTISGEGSDVALKSYLGYASVRGVEGVPSFSDVEIGGGRIMARETSAEYPTGIDIGMYNVDQYMKPVGDHTVINAADGTKWYKQYAQDVVERTPREANNGMIAYSECIVKRLPDPPKRKDKA